MDGFPAKRVSIDTETTGLNVWKGARPFAIGFTWHDKAETTEEYEFPVDPMTRKVLIDYFSPEFKRVLQVCSAGETEKVFFNINFDMRMLNAIDVTIAGRLHDVNLMAKCCNSLEPSYKMKDLARKHLGIENDDETDLIEEVKAFRRRAAKMGLALGENLHEDYWLPKALGSLKDLCKKYLNMDTLRTKRLAEYYFEAMRPANLNVLHSYKKEMELVPTIQGMENRGVRLDANKAYEKIQECETRREALHQEIYSEIQTDKVNLQSGKQLSKLLFETRGLKPKRFTKGGSPSTDAAHLEMFADEDIICNNLIKSSGLKTGIGYLQNYIAYKVKDHTYDGELPDWDTWAIHTTYHQYAASTGRFGSSNPNLQNIANPKTSSGREVVNCREVFCVRPGYVWYIFDYKQLELRIFADRCNEAKLIQAFIDGRDPHNETRVNIPYLASLPEEVGRKLAKNTNFLAVNGGGAWVLEEKYGIPIAQGKPAVAGFHKAYPSVKARIQALMEFGSDTGYIINAYNRKLNIDVSRAYTTASATDIQGSAADLIKRSMINLDKYIKQTGYDAHILLQVHDELIIEVNKKCAYKKFINRIKDIMEDHGGVFSIPMPVDVAKSTTNWFEKCPVNL